MMSWQQGGKCFGEREKQNQVITHFFNTKSLGSNRITIEPQAHPLKNMFLFKMILIQSGAHYIFSTGFSSKLFTYLIQLGKVGTAPPQQQQLYILTFLK